MRNPLARLVRHDPAKPTLRERAASLRASAARVIRRPKPVEVEPDVDWSDPPEGFLPYPVDAPAAFLNIEEYLRLETQRLHDVALAHSARRKAAYQAGGMEGIELAGALDRLRRRLRLAELERAANPERAISTEFTPGDGTILYEDVFGMVHREPVASWIGFMAMHMWAVAKAEESRAFNEKSVPDQEANRPLEDGLRRDLRLDALFDLAFRPDAVFEAARECAIGRGPLAAPAGVAAIPDVIAMSLHDLRGLHDVAETLHDICHALNCQPRCWEEKTGDTPAGAFAGRILNECEMMLTACEKEAKRRKPASSWEADERLCIIARAVIENGDPIQTAAFARDLQATVA